MSNEINWKLVNQFLADPYLWNNVKELLQRIAKQNPAKIAELNCVITSFVLSSLEEIKRNKQFALGQLYMTNMKEDRTLFFNMFYATSELYEDPSSILKDCPANQDSFKKFIKLYKNQKNLKDWRKNYDLNGWLDKLDKWLETNESQNFIEGDY